MTNAARRDPPWSVAQSLELYHVNAWGQGYFDVNAAGHVVVRPEQRAGHEIDLLEVVEGLKARELTAPVVLRFSGILAHRLKQLNDAFARAMKDVRPIKDRDKVKPRGSVQPRPIAKPPKPPAQLFRKLR